MAIKTKTYVRRAERDDLDLVVEWMETPEFQHFLYGDPSRSPKQIREQIVAMLGRSPGNAMPSGIYLIVDSPNYGPIGLLSLQNISWRNRSCSIDLYIGHEKLRHRAIPALVCYVAAEYCFDELNLHRMNAYIYSFNEPSWSLMEKMGAVRELTLKDHVFREGQCHDVYAYGLLRSEFEAFRAQNGKLTGHLMAGMIEEQRRAAEAKP